MYFILVYSIEYVKMFLKKFELQQSSGKQKPLSGKFYVDKNPMFTAIWQCNIYENINNRDDDNAIEYNFNPWLFSKYFTCLIKS